MPRAPTFAPPPAAGEAYLAWKAAVDERRRMEDARRAAEDALRREEDAATAGRAGWRRPCALLNSPMHGCRAPGWGPWTRFTGPRGL